MGQKFPAITDREAIRVLHRIGFELYRRTSGSHEVWRRLSDGKHTVIPRHSGKILKRKTLKSIIKDVGLSVEQFRDLLGSC